jgi:archaellin
MALQYKDLVVLAKMAANANPTSPVAYSFGEEKFSYADLCDTLRSELHELVGTFSLWRENKNTVFALMEETINDYLPKRVLEQYGQFAEIKTFKQGDRPVFTQRITTASKRRAKQFITKVGLAGIYEVFKLDGKSYEVPTSAFGGAAQIGLEEFLDGRVDFADVLEIVMEGLDETIYIEIERALKGAVTNLQAANYHSQAGFSEVELDKLLAIADSYGQSTIYCTYEFAATMVPQNGWISETMKDQKWNNGYLANYKGHRVIVLPQSFEDETNTVKVIDPSYAWIIPTGAEKPVKVAFEGTAIVDEYVNKDRSREIQVYQKVGVGALITNNICVYQNTDLTV